MRKQIATLTVAVMIFVVFYATAYRILLRPGTIEIGGSYHSVGFRIESYRWDNGFLRAIFRPANWLDRKLRPSYWQWSREYPLIPGKPDDSG